MLEAARHASARAVNSVMTGTYWEIGRRIVESEQRGAERAGYGTRLVERLSLDLTARFGRGFGVVNVTQMRRFYLAWSEPRILQTLSEESKFALATTPPGGADRAVPRFPLAWSHYVKLLAVQDPEARSFYDSEALRGGWSVRQLDRQIWNSELRVALAKRWRSRECSGP